MYKNCIRSKDLPFYYLMKEKKKTLLLLTVAFIILLYQLTSSTNTGLHAERDYNEIEAAVHNNEHVVRHKSYEGLMAQKYNYTGALADDPLLIDYIRRELLEPPSLKPYTLSEPSKVDFSQYKQSLYGAHEILHGMRDGIFIEAGALDGEYLSNSLYFERELGWRGVLIEPHTQMYQNLRNKHRKAYTMNVALSTSSQATELPFVMNSRYSGLSHIGKRGTKVIGIPLYSILLALEIQVVDFLSLDVEAVEVKILQTIPWEKVKFRLMCIEVNHIPEGFDFLKKYLTEKGYKFLGRKDVDAWFGWPQLLEEIQH